jgi:hypothetical protein
MLREKPANWQQNQNENQSKAKRNQTGKKPGFFHKSNRGKIELTGRRSGHARDLEKTRKGSRSYKREHERARRRATMDGASPMPRCTRTPSCLWSHRLVPLDKPPVLFSPNPHWSLLPNSGFIYCLLCSSSVHRIWGFCPAVPHQLSEAFLKREESTMRTHTCFTRVIPGGFNHLAYQVVFLTQKLGKDFFWFF